MPFCLWEGGGAKRYQHASLWLTGISQANKNKIKKVIMDHPLYAVPYVRLSLTTPPHPPRRRTPPSDAIERERERMSSTIPQWPGTNPRQYIQQGFGHVSNVKSKSPNSRWPQIFSVTPSPSHHSTATLLPPGALFAKQSHLYRAYNNNSSY